MKSLGPFISVVVALRQVADLINNSTVFPRLSNQMLYYTDTERGGEIEKEDDKIERTWM